MLVAFHVILWIGACVILAGAAYLHPLAAGVAVVGCLIGAYPSWMRERDRLHSEAEQRYRGHAIASERYATREVREIALEFGNRAQAMAEALGDAQQAIVAGGTRMLETYREGLDDLRHAPRTRREHTTIDIEPD